MSDLEIEANKGWVSISGNIDVENEVDININDGNTELSAWINKDQALAIMAHLNKVFEFGLDDYLDEDES